MNNSPNPDAFVTERKQREENEIRRWAVVGMAFDRLFETLDGINAQLLRIDERLAGIEERKTREQLEHDVGQ